MLLRKRQACPLRHCSVGPPDKCLPIIATAFGSLTSPPCPRKQNSWSRRAVSKHSSSGSVETTSAMTLPPTILVNTARGPIVEDAAIHQALAEGWIAAAALDDVEEEPAKQRDWR